MGASAMQSGPLWWASIHRHHHKYSDTPKDIHSPKLRGFWWSHIGWIFSKENKRTRIEYIKDWLKYPELVLLDQMAKFVPIITGVLVFYLGVFLQTYYPELGTNGLQLLIWGFFVSTVFCSHATFSINSIDHMFGTRRYNTSDTSRNNAIMAMLTLGEGWHNNHHHHPITARAGFYWWEIDITYYLLVVLSWLGVVKNLRILPEEIRGKNTIEN